MQVHHRLFLLAFRPRGTGSGSLVKGPMGSERADLVGEGTPASDVSASTGLLGDSTEVLFGAGAIEIGGYRR